MKIHVYMLIGLLVTGCDQSIYQPIEKKPLNNKEVFDEFFNGYDFKFKKGLKRDHIVINTFFIDDSILSGDDFNKIKNNIDKKWKLVYTSEDQYIYCYNKYNEMGIMNPKHLDYYNKFNEKLYLNDSSINKWLISFRYYADGTRYCKDEDFTQHN